MANVQLFIDRLFDIADHHQFQSDHLIQRVLSSNWNTASRSLSNRTADDDSCAIITIDPTISIDLSPDRSFRYQRQSRSTRHIADHQWHWTRPPFQPRPIFNRSRQRQLQCFGKRWSLFSLICLNERQEWTYEYFCRIYGMASFPNSGGQLLTVDDPRRDPQSPSCLRNQSGNVSTRWIYDGSSPSIKSSITILANAFVSSNQTYQWKGQMTNKRNASQQTIGYVLVRIEDTSPPIIIIGFVKTKLNHFHRETTVDLLVVSFKRCASRI